MGILDLPLELVDLIWQHVTYHDLESLALTSSHLQVGGVKRLAQHRDRLDKYKLIETFTREDTIDEWPDDPLNLLRAIEGDREITHYPRWLNLMVPLTDPDEEEYIERGWHRQKGEDCPWYWALLSKDLRDFVAADEELLSWKEDLEEGYRSAIFTLLILLLPNIQVIEFKQWCQPAMMAFPDPLRAFLPGGRARHLASHTLAKVITIEARSWPQEDVEKVHELTDLDDLTRFDGILDPFCTVPTVTRFWGEYMHMEGLSTHLKGKTLHMGHFDCKKSALKLRSLRKLLSCSPQLEYFCFEHYSSDTAEEAKLLEDDTAPNPHLISELLERHGHQLRGYKLFLHHATAIVGKRLQGKWKRMLTSRGHDRPHKQFTVTDVKAAQASEDPIEVFDEEFQELPESGSTTSGSTCSDSPDDASTDDDDGAFEADES